MSAPLSESLPSGTPTVPSCVQRRGKECRDCVECLAAIPNGGTCSGCRNAPACKAMWGVKSPETQHYCQWIPSRYMRVIAPAYVEPNDV